MKYRIAFQIVLSLACVIVSGLTLRWWAIPLWLGVFLYLATTMELVYKAARALAAVRSFGDWVDQGAEQGWILPYDGLDPIHPSTIRSPR